MTPGFYDTYVQQPHRDTPFVEEIESNPKLFLYFQDAVGAIDRTHMDIHPPTEDRGRYQNQKGDVTQNILAACTFDM
jgi:hypothetical protein